MKAAGARRANESETRDAAQKLALPVRSADVEETQRLGDEGKPTPDKRAKQVFCLQITTSVVRAFYRTTMASLWGRDRKGGEEGSSCLCAEVNTQWPTVPGPASPLPWYLFLPETNAFDQSREPSNARLIQNPAVELCHRVRHALIPGQKKQVL